MSLLNERIKRSCQIVVGYVGMAAMTVAAPLGVAASQLPTEERRAQESKTERQQPAPDNSKKNKRDRDDQHSTPMDQGGSVQEIKMTRDIRKGIVQNKDISTYGKNVKIITFDHVVTLRGPVASAEEKQLIYDIAREIAGPIKVKNQLEVKK